MTGVDVGLGGFGRAVERSNFGGCGVARAVEGGAVDDEGTGAGDAAAAVDVAGAPRGAGC